MTDMIVAFTPPFANVVNGGDFLSEGLYWADSLTVHFRACVGSVS